MKKIMRKILVLGAILSVFLVHLTYGQQTYYDEYYYNSCATLPLTLSSPYPQNDGSGTQFDSGDFYYQWNDPTGLGINVGRSLAFNSAQPGTFVCTATNQWTGDVYVSTFYVSLIQNPPPPTIGFSGNFNVCLGNTANLQISNPVPGASYTWTRPGYPEGPNGPATGTSFTTDPLYETTIYTVTGTNIPNNSSCPPFTTTVTTTVTRPLAKII